MPVDAAAELRSVGERVLEDHARGDVQSRVEEAAERARDEPADPRLLAVTPERPHPGVEQHEPGDVLRALHRIGEPDRAAEVVDHQRDVAQLQPLDQRGEVRGVIARAIGPVGGLVGEPEAQVVGRDAAIARRQRADQVAVEERPSRDAVDHDQRRPFPLVHVVEPPGRQLQEPRDEGILARIQPRRPAHGAAGGNTERNSRS
jgi:hypothetical protein